MIKFFKNFTKKDYWISKKEQLIQHYKTLYGNKKQVLIRYLVFAITATFIFALSFGLRAQAINQTFGTEQTKVVANTGISFGALSDSPATVYALQIIPIIATFIGIIHARDPIAMFCITLIFASGLSNVIDRGVVDILGRHIVGSEQIGDGKYQSVNAVIDYWQMRDGQAVFNFPDVFIIVGICCLVLYSFVYGWITAKKEIKKQEELEAAEAAKKTSLEAQDSTKSFESQDLTKAV